MSVPNSAARRPAPYSGLRGLVASHPVVAFLVLAFGFGWISLIPILLAGNGFTLFHLPARFVAGWIVDDHTPLAQVPTVALGYFVSAVVVAVFLRVLIMWVYNGSGRSLIVVGLFHSAFNITIGNDVMPELLNLPASETSLMCLGVLAVLAVAVVVFTRGRLAYQGRQAGAVGVAAQPKMR
jgi:hypothetical protein